MAEFPEVFHADALPADADAFDAALSTLVLPPSPAAVAGLGPVGPSALAAGVGVGVAALRPFEPRFAAIMGNPPFMGGKKITGVLGDEYREYLVQVLANGQRGSADLCAYFFLRAGDLLRQDGNFGLLATNTIAQGDTREVGLDQLAAQGLSIYRAVPSREWPGAAALEVAHLWLHRGRWAGSFVLNDQPVTGITAFLNEPRIVEGTPQRLAANAGKSFQGSIVLGMGFVLEPEEAQALIAKNPRNSDALFLYLNGEDLNSRPDQSSSRWVINFHDWPLERAETYPGCMAIVREKVKPEREKNNRPVYREKWWHYAGKCPALYATIAGMQRVLVLTIVTQYFAPAFCPNGWVYAHRCRVFRLDKWNEYALVQSTLHEMWARQYSSSHETRLNYSPSDCFETFPFPESTAGLESIGERYYLHRQEIMLQRQEGLTKTYNRFHDPNERAEDIAAIRALHAEMDRAVALAYGWGNLDLGHGFHQTK